MTTDDFIGGSVLVVSALLVGVIFDGLGSLWRFAWRGFDAPRADWREAAAPVTSLAILLFGALNLYARWLPVRIDPELRAGVTMACWLLTGVGYTILAAAKVASEGTVERGRWFLRGLLLALVVGGLLASKFGHFHAPIPAIR